MDNDGPGAGVAVVSRYVYDEEHIVLEFNGSNTLTHRYLHGPVIDQILADEDSSNNILWALGDNIGTVRDLINSSGTVQNHIKYNSFGKVTSESNSAVDHLFAFTGRERDEETGLYFYRGRYYDPATGRFLSHDPTDFLGGDANLARYVGNNPVSSIDPTGAMQEVPTFTAEGTDSSFWTPNMGTLVRQQAPAIGVDGPAGDILDQAAYYLRPVALGIIGNLPGVAPIMMAMSLHHNAETLIANTEGMDPLMRTYVVAGTLLADMVGVRGLSDAFSTHDAIDGHEQTMGERFLDGASGSIQLVSTAFGIKGAIMPRPPATTLAPQAKAPICNYPGNRSCFVAGTPVVVYSSDVPRGLPPLDEEERADSPADLAADGWSPWWLAGAAVVAAGGIAAYERERRRVKRNCKQSIDELLADPQTDWLGLESLGLE